MAIKKSPKGWTADVQPAGRGGKRFRKSFKTQADAKQWEAWIKTQATQNQEWMPERRDLRKLSELADEWFELHGRNLRDGTGTLKKLKNMISAMGDPVADRFKADHFTAYRSTRLNDGISANNMNREHAYLRAMFNELIRAEKWSKPNPLEKLRQFRIPESDKRYLTDLEINRLLVQLEASSNPHVLLCAKICLSTGSRWGETEALKVRQLLNDRIRFSKTKSGKNRSVPIDEALVKEVKEHIKKYKCEDRLFDSCYSAFREAVERANLDLPAGQLTHVCRHTFASHFMMNGGNILALKEVLGHASIQMTMSYAHLAPSFLNEATKLNPLSRLTLG